MPDKQRKILFCRDEVVMPETPPRKMAMLLASINITTVLIAVARSVSTPFISTFAKMAVSTANNAEVKHISTN